MRRILWLWQHIIPNMVENRPEKNLVLIYRRFQFYLISRPGEVPAAQTGHDRYSGLWGRGHGELGTHHLQVLPPIKDNRYILAILSNRLAILTHEACRLLEIWMRFWRSYSTGLSDPVLKVSVILLSSTLTPFTHDPHDNCKSCTFILELGVDTRPVIRSWRSWSFYMVDPVTIGTMDPNLPLLA